MADNEDDEKIVGRHTIADEMLLLLGEIKGGVSQANKKIDEVNTDVKQIRDQTITNTNEIKAAWRWIDETKPIIARHTSAFDQGTGAGKTVHIIWGVVCFVITTLVAVAGFLF